MQPKPFVILSVSSASLRFAIPQRLGGRTAEAQRAQRNKVVQDSISLAARNRKKGLSLAAKTQENKRATRKESLSFVLATKVLSYFLSASLASLRFKNTSAFRWLRGYWTRHKYRGDEVVLALVSGT